MTSTPSPSSADPNSADEWIPVGTLVGAQGLRGELRLNPASDFPERFTEPGPRWLQTKGAELKEVELLEGRQLPGKSIYVVRLKGVTSRASAEALVGNTVLVPAADRPELGDGEFHLLDLVGLEARNRRHHKAKHHHQLAGITDPRRCQQFTQAIQGAAVEQAIGEHKQAHQGD